MKGGRNAKKKNARREKAGIKALTKNKDNQQGEKGGGKDQREWPRENLKEKKKKSITRPPWK